ncbi:response regulator [Bosea sp. PAMC 26642]|uniref:response regulator n=1 Tax=Bosea sp. (strain PAMC 26642) TaxID=1792307 RepID=UPI0009EACABB|nr:response regulator [Bosea sp. PAMC 26642]
MSTPTGGKSVLVLEDETIIAMDLEGILTDAGLVVKATLATCAAALEWLGTYHADVALLDMHLLDGSCEPVAKRLVELGIPFVIFSGGSDTDETLDPIFANGIWLEKPAPGQRIVTAVSEALSRRPLPTLSGDLVPHTAS